MARDHRRAMVVGSAVADDDLPGWRRYDVRLCHRGVDLANTQASRALIADIASSQVVDIVPGLRAPRSCGG